MTWIPLPLLLSVANGGEVRTTYARYLALQPERIAAAEAPGPAVAGRQLTLEVTGDTVRFRGRWQIIAATPGWLDVRLVGSGPAIHLDRVRLGGRTVGTTTLADGMHATLEIRGPTILEVEGTVDSGVSRGLTLGLLPGAGPIRIVGDAVVHDAVVVGAGEYWGTASPEVILAPPPPPKGESGTLSFGEAALGITVGEADVVVGGRIRWRIQRGAVDAVAFRLAAGEDLEISGPQVAQWRRVGGRIEVDLRQPEATLVDLDVRWSAPVSAADQSRLSVQWPVLEGTLRTSTALQLARDGQIEAVPQIGGLTAVAGSDLPDWAEGLVQGAVTASYLGDTPGSGHVDLYRYTPAEGPPTLIDVAQYTAATTQEGRILLRAHYAVRNDRGAVLRVTPPSGVDVVGVRVGGETAKVARAGRSVLVPLQRSVETVQGLLTFPVEVTLLGTLPDFSPRGRVPLPVVDVDIAVSRATIHLPPGWGHRGKLGRGGIVAGFSEGSSITYGFAVGDVRAAEADALFQQAVGAWMDNDFDEASGLLDALEGLGADNPDIAGLKSNMYLVEGGEAAGDLVQSRRVREQAWARAQSDVVRQEEILQRAEDNLAIGDYEQAEQDYAAALEIGRSLGKISAEQIEVGQHNAVLEKKLDTAQQRKKSKDRGSSEVDIPPAPSAPALVFEPEPEPEPEPVAVAEDEGVVYSVVTQAKAVTVDEMDAEARDGEDLEITAFRSEAGGMDSRSRARFEDFPDWEPDPPDDDDRGRRSGRNGRGPSSETLRVGDAVEPNNAPATGVGGGQGVTAPRVEVRKHEGRAPDSTARPAMGEDQERSRSADPVGSTDDVTIRYEERTEIDFEAVDVTGALVKPTGELILDRRTESIRNAIDVAEEPCCANENSAGGYLYDAPREPGLDPNLDPNLDPGLAMPEPVVTAASLSVVVPALGEPVRYQRLLLPASALDAVPVRAKRTRRDR